HGRDLRPGSEVLLDALLDRGMHAIRVDVAHLLLLLLVDVLAPDDDADGIHVRLLCHFRGYLTDPPMAPAAMYFCAMSRRMIAGSDERTAVAITALQFDTCVPRYW